MSLAKKIDISIYAWTPVLPFVGYWSIAYVAFLFGPFITPKISAWTHIYFFTFVLLFTISYRIALAGARYGLQNSRQSDDNLALNILKWSTKLFFIGSFLLAADKLLNGPSVDTLINELYEVRGQIPDNVTFITTLGVIPYSFKLVSIGTYFFCKIRGAKIPIGVSLMLLIAILMEIINMLFSANRGILLFVAYYAFFYLIFCKRYGLVGQVITFKNSKSKIIYSSFILISIIYFTWVANNRTESATAEYLGTQAYYLLKNPDLYRAFDSRALNGYHHIYIYLTHGFEYLDAILKHAPLINFDFLSPLGIRVESQIQKISPEYIYPAKNNILSWVQFEGLSTSGWPTMFGASLAYFGIIGSLVFSCILGLVVGFAAKSWMNTQKYGWFLLVFLFYCMLILSIDWIIRDFDTFTTLILVFTYFMRRIN